MPKAKARQKKNTSRFKTQHAKEVHQADVKAINDSAVFPSDWEVSETCPLCGQNSIVPQGYDEPIDGISVESWKETFDRIMEEHPEWSPEDGSCRRCLVYYGMDRAGRGGEET